VRNSWQECGEIIALVHGWKKRKMAQLWWGGP
jgi:hypothetical protein